MQHRNNSTASSVASQHTIAVQAMIACGSTTNILKWDHRAGADQVRLCYVGLRIVLFGHSTRIRGAGTDAKEIPENIQRTAKGRGAVV